MRLKHFYIFTLVIFTWLDPTTQITILKSQFLITPIDPQTNQTVYLLNKTELNISNRPIRLLESIPTDAINSFHLAESPFPSDLIFLTFRNSSGDTLARFVNCVLLLSEEIAVNVSFVERPTDQAPVITSNEFEEDDDVDGAQQIRIEYIFKLDNKSRFGLIKDDTPVNGILCIVRLVDNGVNESDIDLRIGSDYFQVKRFQKQFFMVQLAKSREVFRIDRLFEVNLEAFVRPTKIRLARTRVRFLVVKSRDMDIELDQHTNNELDLDIVEDDGQLWRPSLYGGRFLTRIQPYLTRNVFLDDISRLNYISENLKFRIVSSNYPHPLIEIDADKGILSVYGNKSIDREEISSILNSDDAKLWFNVSVVDQRKLFRPNWVIVNLKILDLNDNAPKYEPPQASDLDLDLNSIHTTHESASINNKHYFLVFNRTASDPDLAENGSVVYFLHSVKSDNIRFASLPKFFVPAKTGQLWVSLESFFLNQHSPRLVYFYHVRIGSRDKGGKYSIVDVHIRMNLTTFDEYKSPMLRRIDLIEERSYYFEIDIEQVTETGQSRLGRVPIRLPSDVAELQPFETNEEFGRYFNLSISRDGLIRVLLNRQFYENQARLKPANHVTSRFSFVTAKNEVKSVAVFLKFVDKTDVYGFGKSGYEFKIAENEFPKQPIGRLDTNCSHLDDIRLVSNINSQFNPNKFLKLEISGSDLTLTQLVEFDFESEQIYDLWVLAKCGPQLLSTRVRLTIDDKNDNLPHFVQPVVNQTFQFTLVYSKLDDYALVQLKAADFDLGDKFSQIKYSIVDNQLVETTAQHKHCNRLTNLTIYLDESSGWLYVGRSGSEEWFARPWCDVEFRIRAVAINHLAGDNEISDLVEFGLSIRVLSNEARSTSATFTWTIRDQPDWHTQPVATYTDLTFVDQIQIDKCWLNRDRHPMSDEFYISLSWPDLYFFKRGGDTVNVSRIECRLVDLRPLNTGSGGSLKRAYSWLVFDMQTSPDLPSFLPNPTVYLELDKSDVIRSNYHLTKFDHLSLIESNLDELMLVYKLADSNENYIQKLFKLDPFTGELRTTKSDEPKLVLETVSLINIDIDILILKVEQMSHRLIRKYSFSVFANLTNQPETMTESLLNSHVRSLDGKMFKKTVTSLDQNRILKIAEFQSSSDVGYRIETVSKINLDTPEDAAASNLTSHPFELLNQNESLAYLGFKWAEKWPKYKPLIYLLRVQVCLKQTVADESDRIFSRRCELAEFNVQIVFKSSWNQLKFANDRLNLVYFSVGEVHVDANFDIVDPTRPLIDLKTLLNDTDWFDLPKLLTSGDVKFRMEPNREFCLDESSGLIYSPVLANMSQTRDYSFDVYLKTPISETRSKFNVLVKRIETVHNVYLAIEKERLKIEWMSVFKMDMIERVKIDVFRTLRVEPRCVSVEARLCSSLFKFNKITGSLLLQTAKLFDPSLLLLISRQTVRLKMDVGISDRHLFDIELNVSIQVRANDVEEPLGDDVPRVTLINTTESDFRMHLIDRFKLPNSSSLQVVRVKNILTNNQVLALGYRVGLSDRNVYYLELDDVLSLELNQLYAFDLMVQDGASSQSNTPASIYFLRFNPYFASEVDSVHSVKFYANLNGQQTVAFNLSKIQADYSTSSTLESSSQFYQKILILNHVKSNRLSSSLIRPYVRIEPSDMIYFDSSQLDIELLGDCLEISVFKFIADKISLKIVRIIEFQIKIETFDESKKPIPIQIPIYYRQIRLAKTQLLNNLATKTTQMGYNYLITDFATEYPHANIARYEIDYKTGDLPFEIDKFTGKLYYLMSEDTRQFDVRGEKMFDINIKLGDLNDNEVDYKIKLIIVDDDPLFHADGLVNKFYIEPGMAKNELFGQIDVLKAIGSTLDKNLTNYVDYLSHSHKLFRFEIVNSNDFDSLFNVQENTGLLFTNKQVIEFGDKFKKLEVRVSGKAGSKNCSFLVDVYVFMSSRILKSEIISIKFQSNELNSSVRIDSDHDLDYFEPIEASKIRVSSVFESSVIRYKLLRSHDNRCEVNWFNGNLRCGLKRSPDLRSESFSVVLSAYNIENEIEFDQTKININLAYDRRVEKSNQLVQKMNQIETGFGQIQTVVVELNRTLKIGERFLKVFDFVGNTTINTESNNLRVYMIENNSDNSTSLISNYFSLDSFSGELVLKNVLLEPRLGQIFKIIQGKSTQLVRLMIEVEEKCLLAGRQQPDESNQELSIELSLRYTLLKYKPVIKLAKIFNYDSNYDYYIEMTSLNKSISDNRNLVLSTGVQIVKKIYSLVQIEAEYLVLNSERFIERNLIRFDFAVVKMSSSASGKVLDRIETRINYKLVITFDDNFDSLAEYMGYNRLDVEKQIDLGLAKVGDVVFDLNRTLLNGMSFGNLLLDLSEPNLPFAVDLSSGNLVVSHSIVDVLEDRIYEFSLALTEKFHIRFRIFASRPHERFNQEKGLCEIQKFKIARNCAKNHFIGSLNNLAGIKDGQFDFNILDNTTTIRLNSSTGDLFCLQPASSPLQVLEVEVHSTRMLKKSFFKTILLYLEWYETAADNIGSNEKLSFGLRILNPTTPATPIWSIPSVISIKYDSCLIISGNYESRFRLSRRVSLIYRPEPDSESNYRLVIRCFSSKLAELDIELDIQVDLPHDERQNWLGFKTLHEIELSVDSFREDRALLKLDPNNNMKVRYEFIQPKSGLAKFFYTLVKIDPGNGDIRPDISNFNKYLQYCEFNSGANQRLGVLVSVKMDNETHHGTTLVKIDHNCDRTYLNLRFKKPYYLVRLNGDLKSNRIIETVNVVDELNDSYVVIYQFCGRRGQEIDLSWLHLDDKTGQLYLNSAEIPLDVDERVEIKVCALLKSLEMSSTITIEADLMIVIEKKTPDYIKPFIRVFNSEAVVEKYPITLSLSIDKLVSAQKNSIKLFKFDATNMDLGLLTTSAYLFDIDKGWIVLRRDALVTEPQTHYLKVYNQDANDRFEAEMIIKIEDKCPKETNIELFVPILTKAGSKLVDVKRFLCRTDEYRYLIINEETRTCDDCVVYNQNDGYLYLSEELDSVSYLNRQFKYELKLTARDADFKMVTINLKFYNEASTQPASNYQQVEIYVSTQTKIGSVIFDSQVDTFSSNYDSFFKLTGGKLILDKNLTNIMDEYIQMNLLNETTVIDLRVYLIEKLSPKFSRSVYYFKYEGKLNELEQLGSLEMTPKGGVKLLTIESNVVEIRCADGDYRIESLLFSVESRNGEIIVLANNREIIGQNCGIFDVSLDLRFESVQQPAKTRILVEVMNLAELKFSSMFSKSKECSNYRLETQKELSILVYEAFGLKKEQVELRPVLIRPQKTAHLFDYDPETGVLMVSSSTKSPKRIQFEIIGVWEAGFRETFIRKLKLNVDIVADNQSSVYYFDRDVFKIDVHVSQTPTPKGLRLSSPIIFDPKLHLSDANNRSLADNWSTSGVTLRYDLNASGLIVFDELEGFVALNETLLGQIRLFTDFRIVMRIQACGDQIECSWATIEVNCRNTRLGSQFDYFREFYQGFHVNNSIKLRKFGFENGYSLYKSRNELLTVDYNTGLISTIDDRGFVIIYNDSYPIRYQPPKRQIPATGEPSIKDNDLVHIDFTLEPKSDTFGYYLIDLDKWSSRSHECEIWSPGSIGVYLDRNCQLFARPGLKTSSSFRVRLSDRYGRRKSIFINVTLNITERVSSSEFIPFYKLTERRPLVWTREPLGSPEICNSIKFNRLSYIVYDNSPFDLTNEGYFTLRLSFRVQKIQFDANLLFHAVLIADGQLYFISMATVGSRLEVRHNLTSKSNFYHKIDHDLGPNIWYYTQVQITEKELMIELSANNRLAVDSFTRVKKHRLRLVGFSRHLIVSQLSLGGLDRIDTNLANYYSDETEIADARLNNHELFESGMMNKKQARILIDDDASGKSCSAQYECFRPIRLINEVNYTLEIKMKPTFRSHYVLSRPNSPRNLTIMFAVNSTGRPTPPYPREVCFLKTQKSVVVMDVLLGRLELRYLNRVRAWIDYNFTTGSDINTFQLISDTNKTRLGLNNISLEFDTDSDEIFSSELLKVDSTVPIGQISVCLQAILIDHDHLALSTGHSKHYSTKLISDQEKQLKQQDFCSPIRIESADLFPSIEVVEKNFNLITESIADDDLDRTPSTIIITVVVSSVIGFVAMLSILANIYMRNLKSKEVNKQIKSARAAMNSRHEFEISLNLSSRNSPISSEICSLSTNHSFNPFAVPKTDRPLKNIDRRNDECLLNCLQLNQRGQHSDYFEYDAFKMGDLTPHAEFIFKKVNLNRIIEGDEVINKRDLTDSNTFSFERQDFDKMRSVLNWEPDFSHYEDIFDEFQKFVGRKHVCNKCEDHIDLEMRTRFNSASGVSQNLSSNYYDEFDKHTFV